MIVYYYNLKLENSRCRIPLKYKKIKYIRISLYDFILEDDDILHIINTNEFITNNRLQTYCKKIMCSINPYIYDEMDIEFCKKNNNEILIIY